jgi:hypothetical protein
MRRREILGREDPWYCTFMLWIMDNYLQNCLLLFRNKREHRMLLFITNSCNDNK